MGNQTALKEPKISEYANEMIEAIIKAVSQYYGISETLLFTGTSRDITRPRQICFWLIRENTSLSSYIIGFRFQKTRNPVDYGISVIDSEKDIYRQTLVDLRNIAAKANSFNKMYQWTIKAA